MKFFIVLWVTILTTSAWAQNDAAQGILECSAIDSATSRLECYDALANDTSPPTISASDNWTVNTDTNPVDDSQTVVLVTAAAEGSTSSTFGENYALLLRCRSGEIEAFINWNDYLGMETIQVTYRIGTASATTDTWYISTDGEATFYSQNEPANRSFVENLAAADNGRLVAQVTPYNENTATAIFNVAGLSDLLPQLYEPCP